MNFKNINELDAQDMKSQIASLYSQIEESIEILNIFFSSDSRYKNIIKDYNNILIIGMGGSAIGGDFAAKYSAKEAEIPIHILRDYHVPKWVDSRTFVIASSYSGNTEETLNAYMECLSLKCDSIIMSTGGELSKIANNNNIGVIQMPKGYQPRAAIGYSLSMILLIFEELGLIKSITSDLIDTCSNKIGTSKKNKCLKIAKKIHGKFPVIYSRGDFMEILAIRLKGQLAENSKILSYNSIFPEHNHNEIEGWNNLEELIGNFVIIWLKDKSSKIEIKDSMEIVSNMIKKYVGSKSQLTLDLEDGSNIEQIFTMINLIDWISYYLALEYKTNPSPINNISKLKTLMKK